jgi:hypothetical protein
MQPKLQLTLLVEDDPSAPPVWSIDDHTREIGRRRVAEAREALRRHRPPVPADEVGAPHAA